MNISEILTGIWQSEFMRNAIHSGYFYGILAVCILIFLLVVIFVVRRIFFRYPRKINRLTIQGKFGSVIVTSQAIGDFVRMTAAWSGTLNVRKVLLMETRTEYMLKVILACSLSEDTNLLDIAENFQENILEGLKRNYGIESIKSVSVTVVNANRK